VIPIVRTHRPESAVNLLLKYHRLVLVQAHYDNYVRVRFRPDRVRDERVYFGKVPSQIKKWRERGGCLVSWRRVDAKEGAHDALVFAECPKSLEQVYAAAALTRSLAVIYMPTSWRQHEATIAKRHKDAHPSKYVRQIKRLTILRDMLETMPMLTRDYLDRRFSRAPSRMLSAPASPEAVALPSGTGR